MGNELDFQYLEQEIFNYSKPISLNSNVSLGRLESRKFRNGIEIKKDNVVIDGNGHTIDAKGKARVFDIYGNNVTLKNINFKNGFHEEYGGAVRNAGRCKLINCTFEDNHAKIDGNAVSNGSEMCVCDCEFSEKDSILNRGSLKTLKDQKPELDSFISGNEATPIIKVPKKDPPVDKDRGKKVPDVSGPDKKVPVGDLKAGRGETGEIIQIGKGGSPMKGDDQSHILNAPFDAYKGSGPFIFVSYKHADWKLVYPIIKKLHDVGFNIWYDANLTKGKYYDIEIADHIGASSLFVTFITEEVVRYSRDQDDYLIKELSVAIDEKIERLPIFLENVKLSGFFQVHYAGMQSIFKHEYGDDEDMFVEACISAIKGFGIEPNDDKVSLDDLVPAYKGSEPYIFLSYSRFDADKIYPDIKRFQDAGYNVWYDESGFGRDFSENIAESLLNSSLFVVFLSNNSIGSPNVNGEIKLASSKKIPILPIYLEKIDLEPDLILMLANTQSIMKYRITEEEYASQYAKGFQHHGF